MEPFIAQIMGFLDFLFNGPFSSILIGLLLPAVQQVRG